MAGTAQDVEAGRGFVTLYLRRANYDKQVADLERSSDQPDRPSQALAKIIGEIRGELVLLRTALRSVATDISRMARSATEAAEQFFFFQGAAKDAWSEAWRTIPPFERVTNVLGGVATGLKFAASGSRIFAKAMFGIAKMAGSAIGAARKMPQVFLKIGGSAKKASGEVAKAIARIATSQRAKRKPSAASRGAYRPSLGASIKTAAVAAGKAAGAAVNLAAAAIVGAAKKIVSALSSIVRSMRSVAVGALRMAGRFVSAVGKIAIRVVAQAGKIAKALAQIPAQLVKATSAAIQRVGVSLAKIGAITTGITAAIVGSATLAAKSWAAYGQRIRGVQNDLMRFQLTAEEASIIARVSDQTGESMERLAKDMRDGTRDFSRWRNELLLSGTLMSGPQLAAALALARAYVSLKGSVLGLKNTLAEALGPTFTEGVDLFTGMVRGVTRWVSANKPLVVQVFKIASAVGIAAGVITTLGGAIAGVGTIITPFAASLAALAGVLAIVEVRTEAGRSIWSAYSESVRRVAGIVTRHLGQMLEFTNKVIGGITDALIAGDLAAAVDIMWSAAKVAWIEALLEIDKLTSGTFGGILQSLAAGKWAAAGEGAMNALQQAWLEGMNVLAGIWDRVVDAADAAWVGILSGFDTVITGLKTGLAELLGWAISNVFVPLATLISENSTLFGLIDTGAGDAAFNALGKLRSIKADLERSLRDEEEQGPELGPGNREGRQEARQAARQGTSDEARVIREEKIKDLKERQAELAGQAGEEAKQEQTANQKALDAALAAAKAARDAAAKNKLQEADFAVSQDVQSIARFSGEALGLSVGRRQDPAEKTAKLMADQVAETRKLRKETAAYNKRLRQIAIAGGFQD